MKLEFFFGVRVDLDARGSRALVSVSDAISAYTNFPKQTNTRETDIKWGDDFSISLKENK